MIAAVSHYNIALPIQRNTAPEIKFGSCAWVFVYTFTRVEGIRWKKLFMTQLMCSL